MGVSGQRPGAPRGDGVITALKARRRDSDRLAVYVDGEFCLELATVVVEEAGLKPGVLLTAEARDDLLERDAPHRARSRSLRLLALRDRSQYEMESRLQGAGFDKEVVRDAIGWLKGLGYLDDDRFAARYVAERSEAGYGRRKVRAELRKRGVARGVIERALGSASHAAHGATGELDPLIAVARRRFGSLFVSDPLAAERKLTGFLARRGYDWEEIGRVIRILSQGADTIPGTELNGRLDAMDSEPGC